MFSMTWCVVQAAEPPQSKTSLAKVQTEESKLRVHFIDVSAGLAVLVETPGDRKHIMIDGAYQGRKDLNKYIANFVNSDDEPIDIAMVTHADQDHFYGFIQIFKDYDVYEFWNTGYSSPPLKKKTSRWQRLLKYVADEEEEGCIVYMPLNDWVDAGMREIVDTGETDSDSDDIVVQYLNVDKNPPTNDPCSTKAFTEGERRNNAWLVFKLIYGDVSFLFTGDINGRQKKLKAAKHDSFIFSEEFELLDRHKNNPKKYSLAATVLQVSHHGSDGASSLPFLKAVNADWAVISAGEAHGHPTKGALRRLGKSGIADDHILRTDEGDKQGKGDEPTGDDSFIFETDGKKITKVYWVEI
jgi:beta-lactamase superfamily II metal-dependent hydrolase